MIEEAHAQFLREKTKTKEYKMHWVVENNKHQNIPFLFKKVPLSSNSELFLLKCVHLGAYLGKIGNPECPINDLVR